MRTRKIYGESKVSRCPFCDGAAVTRNEQKIPVCMKHKNELLQDLKCSCGDYLDIKMGKYGPFFICMNCNIIKFEKGLEINGYPLINIKDL